MNYEIIVKPSFEREAKRMAKHYTSFKQDFAILVTQLEQNPQVGTDLGGGLRKIRMKISSKGKGKSGGARGCAVGISASSANQAVSGYNEQQY